MGLYQIARSLLRRKVITNIRRFVHNEPSKVLVPLNDRKLLQVQGQDVQDFLQGLVTNDMRHFEDGARSVFAMFLNNKGRVLYDTLIHKGLEEHSFLIESDKDVFDSLKKHLNMFKLRRSVKFQDMDSLWKVWVLFPNDSSPPHCNHVENDSVVVYKDPRLVHLGFRLITNAEMTAPQLLNIIGCKDREDEVQLADSNIYRKHRYRLGVAEGAKDLPPGVCVPLEVNCDYLHGVSFHKGCYVGQELTARVYHTGVIRKRLMPIKFNSPVKSENLVDTIIKAGKDPGGKSNLGKLRGVADDYGIGILRIKEALDAKTLKIGDYVGEVIKPSWWPMEAPKEVQTTKNEN